MSEKVTHQNYPQFAARTERAPTENTSLKPHLVMPLFAALDCFLKTGKVADDLKRAIYYGQPKTGADIMANLPDVAPIEAPANLVLTPVQWRMLHAALGMMTETVEFFETFVANIKDGVEFDPVNIMEELGDQNWYQAIAMNVFGLTVEQVMAANIAKLQRRYPEKFDLGQAINRDTAAERAILEQGYAGK